MWKLLLWLQGITSKMGRGRLHGVILRFRGCIGVIGSKAPPPYRQECIFSNQWKIQVADFFSMKLLLLCVWNVWCHRHIMVATDNSECSTDPSACRSITVSEPLRLRQKMSATCKRNQRKIKLQVDVSCIPITQFHPSPKRMPFLNFTVVDQCSS